MFLKIGTVVFATCGRDKCKYFVVLKVEDDFVYIVDGKNRTIDKPKRKNTKHIKLTKTVFDLNNNVTDKKIKKFLTEYSLRSIK